MKKLFRDFKTSLITLFSFIFLVIGTIFLFNLFPMNNYLSYLIALVFYISGGMILYYNVERE